MARPAEEDGRRQDYWPQPHGRDQTGRMRPADRSCRRSPFAEPRFIEQFIDSACHAWLSGLSSAVQKTHLRLGNVLVGHRRVDCLAEELCLAQPSLPGGSLDVMFQLVGQVERRLYHTCMVNDV